MLSEKYRPQTWDEVVGQQHVVETVHRLKARSGLAGRAFWLTGESGTGKTTIARLIARDVAPDECAIYEIDAADLDLETVRRFEKISHGRPLGGGGWAVIINEAHRLRAPVVSRLLTTFELPTVQKTMTFIFTTTATGDAKFEESFDAGPFLSRVTVLPLADHEAAAAFARHVQRVSSLEYLKAESDDYYRKLISDCRCNLRLALRRVEEAA